MSPPDWQHANYADGPSVVRWLEKRRNLCGLGEADRKLIARWRRGSRASFVAVDRLLIGFYLHPSQLPDTVWIKQPSQVRLVA